MYRMEARCFPVFAESRILQPSRYQVNAMLTLSVAAGARTLCKRVAVACSSIDLKCQREDSHFDRIPKSAKLESKLKSFARLNRESVRFDLLVFNLSDGVTGLADFLFDLRHLFDGGLAESTILLTPRRIGSVRDKYCCGRNRSRCACINYRGSRVDK